MSFQNFYFMCMSVLLVCISCDPGGRSKKRTLDPLELELQMAASLHVAMWVLGTEPRYSARYQVLLN